MNILSLSPGTCKNLPFKINFHNKKLYLEVLGCPTNPPQRKLWYKNKFDQQQNQLNWTKQHQNRNTQWKHNMKSHLLWTGPKLEKEWLTPISMALFMSDQPNLEYVKMKMI